jgi:hypothetical protein
MGHFVAQDRSASAGMDTLTVHDEDRARDRPASPRAKRTNRRFCLFHGHPVEIEGIEHRQEAAREIAEPSLEPHPRTL